MDVHEHDRAWAGAFAAERARLEQAPERLAFRDALGASADLRTEYERVLAEHGIELKPDERRLDPAVLARRR